MDAAARIIQHHLAQDDAPDVTFEDRNAVFPPLSSTPSATQTMKIVIFQLFPSLHGLLSQVSAYLLVARVIINLSYQCLKLYGIKLLAIDGAKCYKAHESIVAKFKKLRSCRVLIISSVGFAGLNLAFCSCVIYIVCCSGHHLANMLMLSWTGSNLELPGWVSDWWSCMAVTPGKEVKIYHILTDQTSNIMLWGWQAQNMICLRPSSTRTLAEVICLMNFSFD